MFKEEPFTGHRFVELISNGTRQPIIEAVLKCYAFCIITGVGFKSGNILRYDVIETEKIDLFLKSKLDTDIPHNVACYPAKTAEEADAIWSDLYKMEDAVVKDRTIRPVIKRYGSTFVV